MKRRRTCWLRVASESEMRAAMKLQWILLSCLATISGCSIALQGVVYNNSGQPVFVSEGTKLRSVAPSEESEFELKRPFFLEAPGCTLRYELPPLPEQYIDKSSLARRFVHFQLERGGALFVIAPSHERPIAADSYEQPGGYPLAPEVIAGECSW